MLMQNSDAVMQLLKPSDIVLDIGGWAHPFNRANYIMDAESYETRGYYNRSFAKNNPYPPIGGTVEHFTKNTWIQRDICEKTPFPFRDKELDYVICSHTLEDIRDPLWVCSEMIRIAKRGYVEVPSRVIESCRGADPGIVGLSHHRWLIDIGPSIAPLSNEVSLYTRVGDIRCRQATTAPSARSRRCSGYSGKAPSSSRRSRFTGRIKTWNWSGT